MKIGILGGGLTGLSIALLLQDKHEVEVLEKENACGGLCRSITENGFTFDMAGGHIIFSRDQEIIDFMLRLLEGNVSKIRRNSRIFYKGLLIKYPFENGLSDLEPEDRFECLYEFIKAVQTHQPYNNFKEWMYATFGKGIAEKYLMPYNEKIWNISPEKMATFWIADRVPRPPIEDVIKSSLGISTEGYGHQLYFYYPEKGGIEALVKSIERKISHISKGYAVHSLKQQSGKWVVNNEKIYDSIISTIPLQELAKLHSLPENVKKSIGKLKYNSVMTIMLGFDSKFSTDKHWVYIPDKNILAHRIIYLDNYSACMAPEGKSAIMAEITYNEGDLVSKMTDAEIVSHVISGLIARNLIHEKPIFSRIARNKYGYVVYDLNYEKNIKNIRDYFSGIGLHLCGRFAEFEYLNMDGCIRKAIELAKKFS